MNRSSACACLLLVLAVTWIDRLAMGTFAIAPPTRTPSFGEEVYTIAIRDRDELRYTVEAPPPTGLHSEFLWAPLAMFDRDRLEKAICHRMFGARACYLFMSLQR
ncbi:MAG TPA: hypothetical protein VKU02_05035 [Gemmataceae bacterium]|nr:hypothetical protein [Gemmataceae bacterium]